MSDISDATILIVDDEKDIRTSMENFLVSEGYRVYSASDGQQALDLYLNYSVDLVISDIRMPHMGGLDLLRQIKVMDENMEVIMLTAFASMETAISAMREKGAFEYLIKPIDDLNAFLNTVERALAFRVLKKEKKDLLDEMIARKNELDQTNRDLLKEIESRKKAEKEQQLLILDLKSALKEIKTLRGILPFCMHCKKIRDDAGYWNQVDRYIKEHSEAIVSHSICPECAKEFYPDMYLYDD